MLVEGERRWVSFEMNALESDDFDELGGHLDATLPITPVAVGSGLARFMRVRPVVDAAVAWFEDHRGAR